MVFRSEGEVEAFRIGDGVHPLLDGGGAAASDLARWNSRGRYVIYASEHYATAILEKAAQWEKLQLPASFVFTRITAPPSVSVEELKADDLPGWDADHLSVTQRFGNRWYDEQRSLILIVPSLAAPGIERNVLINQRHQEFAHVRASTAERLRCHPELLA